MATKEITDFTAVTTAAVGDLLLTQQAADSVTRKLTLTQVDTLLAATVKTLTNKTLTTPTIGDFTNATHNHSNAAGGGTLNASAIAAGTLAVARGGTNSGTALNNSRIMVSSGGAIVEAGAMTNGQLLIGSTGAAPVVAALTAGSNITITPGAGTIEIAATGIALGDNPTWTGTHTWSSAGARIQLSNADAQIFLGTTTDRGWGGHAIQLSTAASMYAPTAGAAPVFGYNLYFDGADHKRLTAAGAMVFRFATGATPEWYVSSAANGAQDAVASLTNLVTVTAGAGMQIGAPTGGDKGSGTLNCTAAYDDNTLLTDWAFDLYFDGQVRPGDPYYRGGRLYSLGETFDVASAERRLPWMPTRENFEAERSLGALISRLWFGQEQQQMYVFDLDRRVRALESRPT